MASWKALTGVPSFTPDTMLLMTDGTVLVHDTGGKNWYRVKPDANGKFDTAGVAWSGPFSMANSRQFYPSGVLADGRVFALGGEYSSAGGDTPLGEIFDPQTNTWSAMSKPNSFNWINRDVSACILTDGRVLLGALTSNRSAIRDPAQDPICRCMDGGRPRFRNSPPVLRKWARSMKRPGHCCRTAPFSLLIRFGRSEAQVATLAHAWLAPPSSPG
jgi:hypothetical protein